MELINSSNKDYLNNMLTKVRKAELLCALCLRGMESKKTKYGAGCGWNMRTIWSACSASINAEQTNAVFISQHKYVKCYDVMWEVRLRRQSV